jgi:septal ring factor EnvC (AmiA/AmiB activator)
MQSVTFTQVGVFIGCLIVLLGVAVALKLLLRAEPPLHKEYVSKADHDRDFKLLHDDLTKGASSRKEMHEKMEEQSGAIAELRSETQSQTRDLEQVKKQISAVSNRIDEIPMRTIRLLNETKDLHGR